MGKTPVRMKAVVYSLSPFQQKIMGGLWKDLPHKIEKKISENWLGATLLLTPLVGTYTFVQQYKEKEKLSHRFVQQYKEKEKLSHSSRRVETEERQMLIAAPSSTKLEFQTARRQQIKTINVYMRTLSSVSIKT